MNRLQCLLALLALASAQLHAQAPTALSRSRRVEGELASGDTVRYTIALASRHFVYGEVDQRSVDAVVTIFGPDGRQIVMIDASASGPEAFQFRSAAAGTYRIEITGYQQGAGRYAIALLRVEPQATTPAGRVDQLMAPYAGADRAGAVVAFTRRGEVAFARGYGMANLEYGVANRPATVFHIASLSKQFTAFAVAMLADQGRLSLDDDVRRYLPELPDFGRTITIRHLLTHTSGLRDQWELWGMSGGLMEDVIRQQDLLRLIYRQRELNFEPGAELLYCNTGFTLLSEVVAVVTGQRFPDWMRENVFAPLGMRATQVYDDYQRLVPGMAYSYRSRDGETRKAVLSYANWGPTSVFTTVLDLARWLRNWHTGTVGGPRVLAMMQERGVLTRGDTTPVALGIGVTTWRGQRRLTHSGSDAGYRAFLEYFPALDAGVAVLGNFASVDAGALANAIAEAFMERDLAPDAREEEPPPPPAARPEPWHPTAAELEAYSGTYLSDELETVYTLLVEGGRLIARHRRHGDIPLDPVEPDVFDAGQWSFGTARFERDPTRRVTAMRVSTEHARNVLFRRMP